MARERCLTVGENIVLKSRFDPRRVPFSLKKGRDKGRYLLKNTPLLWRGWGGWVRQRPLFLEKHSPFSGRVGGGLPATEAVIS